MRYLDINGRETSCPYASDSLLAELTKKGVDEAIHVAYTDYGGSFYDKCLIEYLSREYPENIVLENTSYNGKNAFVFGEITKDLFTREFGEYIDNRILKEQDKAAELYISYNKITDENTKQVVYDYMSNCGVCTFGCDYSEDDLDELISNLK